VVKLGVIGSGRVAETRHLPVLRSLPDVDIVAVADIDLDRLNWVADRFHVKHRYSHPLALLENPAIEAVAVCVPAQFHVEVALAALDAGKHLLIEKPLALRLDECDRLIERAGQSPRKVMVGFNMRWHRLVRQAREMIQQQRLGPVEVIRTAFTSGIRYRRDVPEWRKRRELGGGGLVELAVHQFDLWRFLLRTEVEEIFVMSRSGQWDDETVAITARMANGLLANTVISQGTGGSYEVEICGQGGRLQLSCYRSAGLEFSLTAGRQGKLRTPLQKTVRLLKELPQAVLVTRQGGPYLASYRAEWQHFIDCIKRDTPVESTLEDGRRALQVVLAAAVSASRGQPVKVQNAPPKLTAVSIGAAG
jgi:predicted dehydrogenase